jgi:hypothetical protein
MSINSLCNCVSKNNEMDRERRGVYVVLVGKPEERDYLGDQA